MVLVSILICIALIDRSTGLKDETVTVELDVALHEVDEQFLSVTIDAGQIKYNWDNLDFKAPRILNMAKALSPAMIRVGGTNQDFVIFQNSNHTCKDAILRNIEGNPVGSILRKNYTLHASQWDTVNIFVEDVGWEMIFGLNVFLRSPWPNGSWDSANAEELLTYTTSKGYKVNWELGNEPDLFVRQNLTNVTITPEQLAKDFEQLKLLVKKSNPASKFIAGPDVAGINAFFESFLQSIETDIVNAVTWHHYYCNGTAATFKDFLDVTLLDHFIDLSTIAQSMAFKYQPNAELWLGETSSCYGGGSPAFSPTYVAGFMWLDKLGVAALTKHQRVFRQDFVGGNYALLDVEKNPLPDYWLSVLYKRLVGKRVLNVTAAIEHGRTIRTYAHCAKVPYDNGAVVLIMLNLNQDESVIRLTNRELISASRDVYWLTPALNATNLISLQVALNGDVLKLVDNTTLPAFAGERQEPSASFTLPATSFGFYVFLNATAKACMHGGYN